VLRIRRIAGKLEREISLDARAQIEFTAVEERPSAVRFLAPPQIARDLRLELGFGFAKKALQ